MQRRHRVRRHPGRQRSHGTRRIRVLLVADDRAAGGGSPDRSRRMSRRDAASDAATGRADVPPPLPIVPPSGPQRMREREGLGMLVQGLRDTEIAAPLFIADRTVMFHARSISRMLNVPNRSEAVVIVAPRRGIIALGPPASDMA